MPSVPKNEHTEFWINALSNLHTWKRRGQRAVHKPLLSLILIARASAGEEGVVRFDEIEELLEELLQEFGPSRKSYRPEYPFWHLQADGFWKVDAGSVQALGEGGVSLSRSALRQPGVFGYVSGDLWAALVENAELRDELARLLLTGFWPETYHEAIRTAVGLPVSGEAPGRADGRRDPRFREDVLRAYERRCAVCGYDGRLSNTPLGLQAAHVKWWAYDGPDEVQNGIALCVFHHVAFDTGALWLNDDLKILVSAEVNGQSQVEELLYSFSNSRLRKPQTAYPPPDPRYLSWHRREVFQKPERKQTYDAKAGYSHAADKRNEQ